jgi:hypothetical protein
MQLGPHFIGFRTSRSECKTIFVPVRAVHTPLRKYELRTKKEKVRNGDCALVHVYVRVYREKHAMFRQPFGESLRPNKLQQSIATEATASAR